jgi:hypothetical protein
MVKHADADALANPITSIPNSGGAVFTCDKIPGGTSPGVRLVGAFPSLNSYFENLYPVGVVDSVTSFTLQCE